MSERIKVSRVKKIGYRTTNIKMILTERWQVVLLVSLFWAGLIIGCIYINQGNGNILMQVRSMVESSIEARYEYSNLHILKAAVLKYGVFLILSFVLGLSAIGYPFVCAVPLLAGISNGFLTGYLYGVYGVRGFLYCLTTIYPALTLATVALIVGACEGLEMSVNIFKIAADKNRILKENPLRKYGYQFCILFSLIILSGIIEIITCNLFLGKFNV